jgi:hypothetical protein
MDIQTGVPNPLHVEPGGQRASVTAEHERTRECPESPPTLQVGEGAENSAGSLTVTAAERYTEPPSRFGEPPENDVFLQVTIHAETVGDEVYRVSASDFYIRDDHESQYEHGGGSSLFEGGEHSLSCRRTGGRVSLSSGSSAASCARHERWSRPGQHPPEIADR